MLTHLPYIFPTTYLLSKNSNPTTLTPNIRYFRVSKNVYMQFPIGTAYRTSYISIYWLKISFLKEPKTIIVSTITTKQIIIRFPRKTVEWTNTFKCIFWWRFQHRIDACFTMKWTSIFLCKWILIIFFLRHYCVK